MGSISLSRLSRNAPSVVESLSRPRSAAPARPAETGHSFHTYPPRPGTAPVLAVAPTEDRTGAGVPSQSGVCYSSILAQGARNGKEDETTGSDDAVLRQAALHPLA